MKNLLCLLVLGIFVSTLSVSTGFASGNYGNGSYGGHSPIDANSRMPVDSEKYDLGSLILAGKVELPEDTLSQELYQQQLRGLVKLKKKLPKRLVNSIDARNLEGRLTEAQFKALKYFLNVRYLNPSGYEFSG